MNPSSTRRQRGFVLLPVVLTLALVATLAFLLNRESGMGVELAANEARSAQAHYVAEAGLAQAGWMVNQSGCTGYADLTGVSFAGGSYDVIVTPTEGSPVTLTSAARLPDGTRGTLTRNSVRAYQPPETLTQQPGGATGQDTYLYEWKPTWNYGVSDELLVTNEYAYSLGRSLLRFSLDEVPPQASIRQAVLELFQHNPSAKGGTVAVSRVTTGWGEGDRAGGVGDGATWQGSDTGTSWSAPGGDYDPLVSATATLPAHEVGWFQWDVTPLVDDWVSGAQINNGLILAPQGPQTTAYFRSSDNSDPTLRPKLTITYSCECGVDCGGPNPAAARVLYMVTDPGNPTPDEAARQTLMESWGFTVTPIDDDATSGDLATALAVNDVVYVSQEITTLTVAANLRDTTLGIVNEEYQIGDDLGLASGTGSGFYNDLNVVDDTHEITAGFGLGPLALFSPAYGIYTGAGFTLAPDLQVLGEAGSLSVLVAMETGGALWGGGTAAGRRVQVPWGADFSALNADGRTIMRRAIEWAAGPATTTTVPVAHWKLDETSGPTAVDSVGGHDGTWTGGPSWAPGAVDGGLSFDGTNDYVAVPHSESLAPTGGMSFAAWAKPLDTSGGYRAILAKDTPGNGLSNYWFGISNDELAFGFWAAGGFRVVQTPSSNLQPDTWHHLAASFDDAADMVRLYVDGVEAHAGAFTYAPTTETADLWIGHSVDGEYWHGTLDDVRIYPSILSAGEVAVLASAGSPPTPSGPLTLGPVADAAIYEGAPDTNYGTQETMRVGEDSGGSKYRSLVRFDLSGVPADATVAAATLRTYIAASSGNKTVPVGVYTVTDAWEETAATWANTGDGGTYGPTQLAVSDIPKNFTGWVEWALPIGLIHEWVDGITPNHGLLLNYEESRKGNFRSPATRENPAAEWRPQLVIEYVTLIVLPPPEPVPM